MEEAIKRALKTTVLKSTKAGGGGCINKGEIYLTDNDKVFIKRNSKDKARIMFDGEFQSLKVIEATQTVRVPKPHVVVDNPKGGAAIVLECIDIKSIGRNSNVLGKQLARLHLYNIELEKKLKKNEQFVGSSNSENYISKFGFHIQTSCGYIAQDNTWCDDWPTFYARKLQEQMDLIEKEYGDREALKLWSELKIKIPEFFKGVEIKPSLLHGDLWSGNVGDFDNVPVIFDPASFYGHHEYDLAIAALFGGFSKAFWQSYHEVIPKTEGWDRRHQLYTLFHQLNHWNHFGTGYRGGSLQKLRSLTK